MKYHINLIFIVSLLTSLTLANISEIELDKYKKVSIVDELLESNQQILLERLLVFYNDENIQSKTEAINFIYNKKFSAIYFNVFKNFTRESYNKVIKFYTTDVGEKYLMSEKKVLMLNSKIKIQKEFINLKLSKEKEELINSIIEVYDTLEFKMKYAIRYFEIYNNGLPLEMQMSKVEMEQKINRYLPAMVKYQSGLSKLIYNDFTVKELALLLSFAESEAGQNENKLRCEAEYIYMESIIEDFMKLVRKKIFRLHELKQ